MRRLAERALWILATCVAVRAVAVADEMESMPTSSDLARPLNVHKPASRAGEEQREEQGEEQRAELTDSIIEHDPFRLARRPADMPFGSSSEKSLPSAPPVQRPALVLAGIVGGPPWEALLEGIPGREGSVVARTGEEVAGFLLVRVDRRGVTLRGHDTTVVLAVRRAGQ